ncbi:Plant invertase/pectin methylesterase inhibitor superfamily protein [Striga hermonthica]|uniref:pectinesterase n=1 Tax=Striga hermonthica TaxID=68872 RepID=A0A9N7NB70_STRHE|nr:Plant invertase/pectin methylesterase inhibitor superfamily protein [Striga hermonthica]
MESINFIKGYGKVNPADDRPNPPPNPRRKIIFALSLAALLLMTVAIVSLVAVAIIESATESEESEAPSQQLASNSLRTVCAVTRYPDSCFSSISPLNSPPSSNPLRFFNLSLQASTASISCLKSHPAGPEADPAMKDCAELFDDAASQLGRSADSIRVERGEKVLTETKIGDLKTWISGAMTDLETCLDGLSETGSPAAVGGEFRAWVQKSQEHTSNTLAILNNIPSLCKKFGIPMP